MFWNIKVVVVVIVCQNFTLSEVPKAVGRNDVGRNFNLNVLNVPFSASFHYLNLDILDHDIF